MPYSEHWNWVNQYEEQHRDNPKVQAVVLLAGRADDALKTANITLAHDLYYQAYQQASASNLLELELIYRYYTSQCAMRMQQSNMIDEAVKIIIKAQNLDITTFPWYPFFQLHLMSMYGASDPLSYVEETFDACGVLENEYSHNRELISQVHIRRIYLALAMHDYERAQVFTSTALAYTQGDSYYFATIAELQGHIYSAKKDTKSALEYYMLAEKHASSFVELITVKANSIIYQGNCHLLLKNNTLANQRFAFAKQLEINYTLALHPSAWFAHMVAEHRYDDILSNICTSIEQYQSFPYVLLMTYLLEASFLDFLGKPIDKSIQQARETANQLKTPEAYADLIDLFATGGSVFYSWQDIADAYHN
ncbi:MAG: hypothetical protein AAF846_21900 [Chloroflexota bacterium]